MVDSEGKIRLQKFLAEAGVAARRAAEDMVLEGRVSVNGRTVEQLPVFVDPEADDVRVDGRRVRPEPKTYVLLHKPKGTVTSRVDPAGRRRVMDLVADVGVRLFPVGRLEIESDGLMLLTNDGELAQRLTHPRYGIEKIYRAEVRGQVSDEDLKKLRQGMWFSDGRAGSMRVTVVFRSRDVTIVDVGLRGGINRQIPRMVARLGYKLKRLTLLRIGRLTTKGMPAGAYRHLKPDEVKWLRGLAQRLEREAAEPAEEGAPPPRSDKAGRGLRGRQRGRASRQTDRRAPRRAGPRGGS